MFRDSIEGIDKLFLSEVPRGSIILITGPPGTLKSALACNIMASYLSSSGDFGVYMNLEESTESHLRNMHSMGIDIPESLFISDYSDFRARFDKSDKKMDFLEMVEGVINFFHHKEGERFSMLTLDSLGALYSIIPVEDNLRVRMYNFFRKLRDLNITSFIIMERPILTQYPDVTGAEEFLADGIIEMGMVEREPHHEVYLYTQVVKMRATKHKRVKYHIDVTDHGLHIVGPGFD